MNTSVDLSMVGLLIHFNLHFCLGPRKVLVSTLKPPRKEFKLRDIDNLFVKSLIAEFKENEVLFGLKPLLAIVKGVSKHEEFREELLDSYELEVIGGNHHRAAMQHFLQENPDDLKSKYTEVILLTGEFVLNNYDAHDFIKFKLLSA